MGVFRQLGDPVCPDCLCQHHEAAYAETIEGALTNQFICAYSSISDNLAILQQAITITERCCIAVNAATVVLAATPPTAIEIERPLGTIRTTQESLIDSWNLRLLHHAAWEVLDPGTHTYTLVNRAGAAITVFAAWLKIITSDCEG